jgi:hypothetical protein
MISRVKNPLLLPLVFFAILSAGCQARGGDFPEDPTPVWGEVSNGVKASLAMRDSRIHTGQPIEVLMLLENAAPETAALSTIPAFILDESAYWCPVDIVHEGAALPANTRVTLSLDPHATSTYRFDISALTCGASYSSIWPDAELRSILTPGMHALRLDLEVTGGREGDRIRSNEAAFEWTG